jgi:rubrerythrin
VKVLSVEEVVGYAIKIEEESVGFYRGARELLSDDELRKLVEELAQQEEGHVRRLQGMLMGKEQVKDHLKGTVNVDASSLDRIVSTKDITEVSTPEEIFRTALEREVKTKEMYEMFLGMVHLSEALVGIFGELKAIEEEHIRIITERIQKVSK